MGLKFVVLNELPKHNYYTLNTQYFIVYSSSVLICIDYNVGFHRQRKK